MGVSSFTNPVMRQQVRVMTVDMSQRRCEVVLKDGAMVQVAIFDIPPFFRVPTEGEIWYIRRENNTWYLDNRLELAGQETHPVENLAGGNAKIASTTIYDANGNQLSAVHGTPTNGQSITWSQTSGAWVPATLALDSVVEKTANKGAASGYAPLNANALVPLANLPYTCGSVALTWTASATSATATVTHGLGTTPTQVVLGLQDLTGKTVLAGWGNATSTTFQVVGGTTTAATYTGSATFSWAAYR